MALSLTASQNLLRARNLLIHPVDPPKPVFDPKMETIVQPIVGWRKWKADLWSDTIVSVTTGTAWPVKKPLKAACNAGIRDFVSLSFGSGRCRGLHCTCGVYAFRTEDQVRKQFPVSKGPSLTDPAGILGEEPEMFHIYGEVNLWGRIIEHEHGYRAQYAYPKSFVNNGPIAQKLAEVYGVELLPSRSGE